VECPTHGELAVFNNFADYAETLKAAINQSNDAMGLTRIDPDAKGIFEQYS
jgi:secreted protein with Ig-like and vWFA domain